MSECQPRKRGLVVDDESGVVRLLDICLRQDGFDVTMTSSGAEALAAVQASEPDVVVLDVLMPQMNGFEVCRRIREICNVPIIMLTALRANEDVVRGLDAGADEYVTKPFSIAELSARIRAILRRVELERALSSDHQVVCDGGRLIIDFDRRQVLRDGRRLALSDTEFRLLSYLVASGDRALPHEQILEHVWGPEHVQQTAYLRTYVRFLRRKIESDPQSPRLLVSVHGVGYRFQRDPS